MDLKYILESILFSSQEPLSTKTLRDILTETAEFAEEARPFKRMKDDDVLSALDHLATEHEQAARSFRLVCVAGLWQFVTLPSYAPWVKTLVGEKQRPTRLSQPALETLAVIAYRQPVTRAEIEQIRGVTVDGVMQTLLERGLVQQAGRAEVIGRPMTYTTTTTFMEYFGLRSLEDLPSADELRRVPITKPEGLLTVDAGLTTAPQEQLPQMDASALADTSSPASPDAVPPSVPATDTNSAPTPEP